MKNVKLEMQDRQNELIAALPKFKTEEGAMTWLNMREESEKIAKPLISTIHTFTKEIYSKLDLTYPEDMDDDVRATIRIAVYEASKWRTEEDRSKLFEIVELVENGVFNERLSELIEYFGEPIISQYELEHKLSCFLNMKKLYSESEFEVLQKIITFVIYQLGEKWNVIGNILNSLYLNELSRKNYCKEHRTDK